MQGSSVQPSFHRDKKEVWCAEGQMGRRMQIALHIGANCTDDDRLLKSILKNNDVLSGVGTKAPGPSKYRRLIRETIQTLNGMPPAPNTRQVLLDAMLDEDEPERLVLANPNFICISNRIFDGGSFYAQAEFKLQGFLDLFPDDDVELFLGLRNPATFLPAVYADSKASTVTEFLHGMQLGDIRWSDLILRLREAAPDVPLTVWCNEDTPIIWADLIRRMCGLDAMTRITGGHDLLASVMSPAGMARFLAFLRENPPKSEAHKRKIIMAFLDKFALDDEMTEEVDLPGMDAEVVAQLTSAYDQDVDAIAAMPGVTFVDV